MIERSNCNDENFMEQENYIESKDLFIRIIRGYMGRIHWWVADRNNSCWSFLLNIKFSTPVYQWEKEMI